MVDKTESESDGNPNHSVIDERRRFLQLLTAGVGGGAVAVGLSQIIGEDGTSRDVEPLQSTFDAFVYQHTAGYESVDSDGNTIHSDSDGWIVLENSIGAVPDDGSIYVSGRFESTSTITVRKSIRMYGHDAYIALREPIDRVFRFEGDERYQTSLTGAAETSDNAVELDETAGIQKGDIVLLEEENGDPVLGRGQPPGEPHSVLEVDGGTVRLEDSIAWRDGYPPGTLVYVIDPVVVTMAGFSMSAPEKDENYYGVTAYQCRDSIFENLWLDKFGSRAIMLEACANCRIRDCTVLQSSDIEAADGYGIQIWAGCHDIIVEGCVAKECRHPLSVTAGGSRDVASRSITFRDCFVTADGNSALNCHGGAAHNVRFEGCEVHTWGEPGVRTGAQETNVSGCRFRMDGHNAIHTRNDGQEMIITVTDTDIFGAGNAVKLNREVDYDFDPLWKLVHLENVRAYGCGRFFDLGRGEIDGVRNLVVRGCNWDVVNEEGLRIWNRLDGGIIKGNNFGDALNDSHIRAPDGPNTNVNDLLIVGNRFRQTRGTDAFIQLSHSERCVVSDNKFEAGTDVRIYVDDVDSTGNIIKQNTYSAPDASVDPVDVDGGSLAIDNRVYDTDAGIWVGSN